MAPDPKALDAVHQALDAAAGLEPAEALPHLREAADRLTALIDESMAEALVAGRASLRSAGASAGLSENAVPPRLAPTQLKETAMTRADLTHLYFLLDRSGSMQSIKTDTEGGFEAFIAEQRKAPGDCRVTLAQFDNQYD